MLNSCVSFAKHAAGCTVGPLHRTPLCLLSISLIEPGPVITEFERKVYEEGMKTDLSKADKITADMFTNIYLKNYNQIFETFGQTADDVAEVKYHIQYMYSCVNAHDLSYRSVFFLPAHSEDHHHGQPSFPSPDKHSVHPDDHSEVR